MTRSSGYGLILLLCLCCLTLLFPVVNATEFTGGQSFYLADTVEINDDLFVGGQNITISGHVRGDLFLSAMSVSFDGEVNGSVMAFVYDFKMTGHCRNSVRTFAFRTDIDGRIERNLMAFGQTVVLGKKGWVEKDVHVGGASVTIQGRIGGDLEGGGGQIFISGQIDGDVNLEAENIVIQPTAIIGGNLISRGDKEPKIEPGAQILGEIKHQKPRPKESTGYTFGDFMFDCWSFLALALVGGLLLAVCRTFAHETTGLITGNWLKALGLGFVFFVCLPIAGIILLATVVGIPAGIMVMTGWLALFYLAKIFAGITIGEWVFQKLRHGKSPGLFWSMLVGLLIIFLLGKIPYLSFVVGLAVIFLAFGGFFMAFAQRHNRSRQVIPTGADPGGDEAAE